MSSLLILIGSFVATVAKDTTTTSGIATAIYAISTKARPNIPHYMYECLID